MNNTESSEEVGTQVAGQPQGHFQDTWREDSDAPHLPPEPRHRDLKIRLIETNGD